MILLKFGTEQFYMFTNNNLDYNLEIKFPFHAHLKKVKLFIYGANLLKFEAQIFICLFTDNKL